MRVGVTNRNEEEIWRQNVGVYRVQPSDRERLVKFPVLRLILDNVMGIEAVQLQPSTGHPASNCKRLLNK